MVLNVNLEATETYFHKNVYTSDVKRATLERLANLFLCFLYIRLVISSTERQHTIISNVHKGLGHDKAMAKTMGKAMALYSGKEFNE